MTALSVSVGMRTLLASSRARKYVFVGSLENISFLQTFAFPQSFEFVFSGGPISDFQMIFLRNIRDNVHMLTCQKILTQKVQSLH